MNHARTRKRNLVIVLVAVTSLALSSGCRPNATDRATDRAADKAADRATDGVADGATEAEKGKTQPRAVRVAVLAPTQTTMERTTTQPATVHAYYEASLYAKASGYLTDLKVDIGTPVKKGDVLAVISIPEMGQQREAKLATIRRMQAEERRAASQLAVAKASVESYQAKRDKTKAEVAKADAGLTATRVQLDRVTKLVNQNAVANSLQDESQKHHDAAAAEKTAAEAAVSSADAELTLARAQIDAELADLDVAKAATEVAQRELEELDELIKYAQIIAPFDGVVTQRNAEPGDLVRNAQNGSSKDGKPLFLVSQFDMVRVRVYVPERDVPHTNVDDSAEITLQALPGEIFPGKVSRVAGALDEQTRTMMVEIDIDNSDHRIRPGMFGQARIALAAPGDSLTLPANAVHFDNDGNASVYIVDDSNQVVITEVETGLDDGASIEITAGLSGSERIIGPLLKRLKAGQTVNVN